MVTLEELRQTQTYQNLCGGYTSTEGNLLQYTDDNLARIQIKFFEWAFEKANHPKVLLETGTNHGFFGYLAQAILGEIKLYTFDIDPNCVNIVKILNGQTKAKTEFIAGDSRTTLTQFNPLEQIDFAWIDGSHDTVVTLFDLRNCGRLKIPYIAVDDCKLFESKQVILAVDLFLADYKYVKLFSPYFDDDSRGAILLEKQ